MPENTKKIPVRFKTPSTYRTYTADGVVSGELMDNNVILEFYIHKQDTPDIMELELDNDGNILNSSVKQGFSGLTREKQFGLVMSIDKIVSLKEELEKKIEQARKRRLI